ncbi:hypothetical protein H7347_06230 [Corynebacterium sp. zg-331]|uniref:hypothetical protein n=1 Tax=unclassified Corynebacterium TaxID=2624378 RepID=UPI0016433DB4|nr:MULTISPECIES: hypothetical protein [unclassified Corynebacterium]MBC3186172.1 hypothetical protein [Corynebacterium sp. zg-331]
MVIFEYSFPFYGIRPALDAMLERYLLEHHDDLPARIPATLRHPRYCALSRAR